MSNINLKQFYGILKNNPLIYGHQFVVTFGGDYIDQFIPGGSDNLNAITYYVKSTKVPTITIAEATVNFMSQEFVIPKNVQYGGTWDVTLLATNDMTHYNALRDWSRQFADLSKNGGGQKTIPDTYADVRLLDSTMQNTIETFRLVGIFPTKVGDLSMKYENNANIPDLSVTFAYQYSHMISEDDPMYS